MFQISSASQGPPVYFPFSMRWSHSCSVNVTTIVFGTWTWYHREERENSEETQMGWSRDWQTLVSGSNPAHCLFLWIKCYWTIGIATDLNVVCGCFCVTMAELDSWNRDDMPSKHQILTLLPFMEKCCQLMELRLVLGLSFGVGHLAENKTESCRKQGKTVLFLHKPSWQLLIQCHLLM